MSKRISELTEVTAPLKTDTIPIVQAGVTKRILVRFLRVLGITIPEDHGAIGDGATDDTASLIDITSDHVAASTDDLSVVLAPRTYLANTVTGTIGVDGRIVGSWSHGLSIFGQGAKSLLKTSQNAALFIVRDTDAADRQKAATFAHFALQGDGKASGKTFQDLFRIGFFGSDGTSRDVIIDVYAKGAGGIGLLSAYTDLDGAGSVTIACRAEDCGTGLVGQEGEHHGYWSVNNTIGVRVGGNCNLIGGQFEDCTTAYSLDAGGNDAHGVMVGTSFTHNTTALNYGASVNGQYATGIRIFDGALTMAGNTRFHTFNGCFIAGTTYTFTASKVRFIGCTFGRESGGYHAGATFGTGGNGDSQIEFIDPRAEDGLIPSWIGAQYHPSATYTSNADKTLSFQHSWAPIITIADGSATATVNLFNQRTPSQGERQWVVNREGQTVNYYWATGTGIAIPTNKSALIGFSSGGNMICFALVDNVATSVARP